MVKKIFLVLIFMIVIFVMFQLLFEKNPGRRERGDILFAQNIETAVKDYIALSNDEELKFNSSKTVSVDELLVRFQKPIIIDGEMIGPLLSPQKDPPDAKSYYPRFKSANKGWKIVINKKTKNVSVNPDKVNQINIQKE